MRKLIRGKLSIPSLGITGIPLQLTLVKIRVCFQFPLSGSQELSIELANNLELSIPSLGITRCHNVIWRFDLRFQFPLSGSLTSS
jgi:hypothetical protein